MTKLLSKKSWLFIGELVCFAIFWVIVGQVVVKKQICAYQGAANEDLVAQQELWEYVRFHNNSVVLLSYTSNSSIRGSIQLYLQDIPLKCIEKIDESGELPDILFVDGMIEDDYYNFEKYHFAGFLGTRRILISNKLDVGNDNEQWELNKNIFVYNHEIGVNESGFVMSGPYFSLYPGKYEVVFQMGFQSDGQEILGMADVISNYGETVFCSTDWDGSTQDIVMRFCLEEKTDNIEFRYLKYAGNSTIPLKVILISIGE